MVMGMALIVQGGFCLVEPHLGPGRWLGILTVLGAGTLLLIGFLTTIAGAVAAVGPIGAGLSLFPACTNSVFDARLTIIFSATMLLAIVLMGAGAFSVDARVFGRREIIIPRCPKG
jgi:uncharacterized membrane protein YphA (DoxX/SURF4 family)